MTIYFAYGANMNTAEMADRCPGATLLGPGLIDHHRFRIGWAGYGTVVPRPGSSVLGMLWRLSPDDEAALDRFESLADGLYRKEQASVRVADGATVPAMIYRAADPRIGRPTPGYLESVIDAAVGHRFPTEYVRQLGDWLAPPLPNCYRLPVEPPLWGGEYPAHHLPNRSRARVQALVDHGVSFFVDLTEEGELEPYDDVLPELVAEGEPIPGYRRLPIPDMSTPERTEVMTTILDTIDDAVAEGHRVYVHCWGGIGRTGTVLGCWLARRGTTGDDALDLVSRLFGETPKGQGGRRSPETDEQVEYVRAWREGRLLSDR